MAKIEGEWEVKALGWMVVVSGFCAGIILISTAVGSMALAVKAVLWAFGH
jgi:hypothetical protein